jgi:phosphate starvation-inducible PhoH-like protein|tara:strand:- start:874 stop:1584 length:711 start_codon:yes stop_codon:yes gene_type:complete
VSKNGNGNGRWLKLDDLITVGPLTENQKTAFEAYKKDNKSLILHGSAGTGKTFISIYLALEQVLEKSNKQYNKLYVIRSVVPTRDIGYLPGDKQEKIEVYEDPYMSICAELFECKDAYEKLKQQGVIEFLPTSFVRGITFDNSIIIIDECQNLNFHELDSVITRIGKDCKILFCGDFYQTDFVRENEKQGLKKFIKILNHLPQFANIEFSCDDIVRSDLVKSYILAKNELREQGII